MRVVREVEQREDMRCRFADAENYHLSKDKSMGYMGAELAQLISGGKIVEKFSKGLR